MSTRIYQDILVPTDGSQEADVAVDRALNLARTSEATVHVVHVVDTSLDLHRLDDEARTEWRRDAEKRGQAATVQIEERASSLGLETARDVVEGVPYREILTYVEENGIDLVVMGTRSRTASRLGSTTERVVALADVPVIAVPLAVDTDVPESGYGMYDHVLIPTDGSDAAERAADHGLRIAERYGADVHLVYVVDESTYGFEGSPGSIAGLLKQSGGNAIEEIAADARERNLPVTTDVVRGIPHEEILDYAEGVDADLIAMGTRGRVAETDRLFGSTTARIVRCSTVPVLTRS
ncbi:universal stress protein [Halobellus ordinarius]|uniref:universal stress protein n=1 Tax=Halobellus ordinarius TaxID=3075120 RepID=UPI0028802750|nr:universal stress protein [Halobellus sp. ZY16]